MRNSDVSVILLAGGKGLRMGLSTPKQFLTLQGVPIALYSLETFFKEPDIKEIIVVVDPAYQEIFSSYPVKFALPGNRRQDSLYNGLKQASEEWICVHDAARPFIRNADLSKLIKQGKEVGAATLGVPVKWTVKECCSEFFVKKTLDRSQIWEIQTPQFLSKKLLNEGFEFALDSALTVTDDVSLAEAIGHPVKIVPGDYSNIKITTREDLTIAGKILESFSSVRASL